MVGLGTKEQLTPATNAKIGDRVLITKGPAIEATGILAYQAEKALEKKFGQEIVRKGQQYFFDMSVVEDALIAAPNANAMHDATEGGLLNGVYEIVAASGTGVTLYEDRIPVPSEIANICGYFNIDPLISISEGTLVITAAPDRTPQILADLAKQGIAAWDIGEITLEERLFVRHNGQREELLPVSVDPFWEAYFSTLEG